MLNRNLTWTELYLYDHNRVLIGINAHVRYWNGADGTHLPHFANCLFGSDFGIVQEVGLEPELEVFHGNIIETGESSIKYETNYPQTVK
jgi:hypothetical protein